MITELIYVDQISVEEKIQTIRLVEVKGRKQNVYIPFFVISVICSIYEMII